MEEIRNEEVEVKGFDLDEEFFEEPKETKKSLMDNVKDLVGKAKVKVDEVVDYVKENPEEAAEKAVGGVTALGIGALVLLGIRDVNKASRTVYSDDINECVELKRKLTNKDKTELDYRVRTGQTKVEALDDMNLIK